MSGFIASANIFVVILIKGSCVFIRNVSGFITSAINIFAIILIKGHN